MKCENCETCKFRLTGVTTNYACFNLDAIREIFADSVHGHAYKVTCKKYVPDKKRVKELDKWARETKLKVMI
jgi:hypothetical protein